MDTRLTEEGLSWIKSTFVIFILQITLFYLASWNFKNTDMLLFWITALTSTYIRSFFAIKYMPEVANLRGKNSICEKKWDDTIEKIIGLCSFLIPIFAGIELGRLHLPKLINNKFFIVFLLIYFFANLLLTFSMKQNNFFDSVVKIQENHKIMSNGLYSLIRHPGYLANIITFASIPFCLNSYFSLIPSLSICVAFIVLTILEDKTLIIELPGYKEYTTKVKYKLIPGIW